MSVQEAEHQVQSTRIGFVLFMPNLLHTPRDILPFLQY